jgi:hypothetical protein
VTHGDGDSAVDQLGEHGEEAIAECYQIHAGNVDSVLRMIDGQVVDGV